MSTPHLIPGKFVWFEYVGNDVETAQGFYGAVFGWRTVAFPMGGDAVYQMIYSGDTMIGGYSPRTDRAGRAHWLSYVSVDDVDACAKIATYKGGTIIEAPHDIPNVGRTATIRDPQGAEFAMIKRTVGDDPADHAHAPDGQWLWNELHTTDPPAAIEFYEALVGYTHKSMDMGPGGTYHTLHHGETGRAGVTSHLAGAAPHWLPYVTMSDVDATIARARKAGGRIPMSPEDIRGVGRFGIVQDPTGATVAMLNPLPKTK
jgi:predicted enzyme related to lactoylglutathione lyase